MDFDAWGQNLRSGPAPPAVIRSLDKSGPGPEIRAVRAEFSYFYMNERGAGQVENAVPARGTGVGCGGWLSPDRAGAAHQQARGSNMLAGSDKKKVEGHTIMALGDGRAWPTRGLIAHFPPRDRKPAYERKNIPQSGHREPDVGILRIPRHIDRRSRGIVRKPEPFLWQEFTGRASERTGKRPWRCWFV